jgi:hypothetical protein
MPVICLMRKADYFLREEWTRQITLELLGKLVSGRIEGSSVNGLIARSYFIPEAQLLPWYNNWRAQLDEGIGL